MMLVAVFIAVAALQSCQCHCCYLLPAMAAIVIGWLIFHFDWFFSLLLWSPHCHCYCCRHHFFAASYTMVLQTSLWLLLGVVNAIIIAAAGWLHRCWSLVDCCFFSNEFLICYCSHCSFASSAATKGLLLLLLPLLLAMLRASLCCQCTVVTTCSCHHNCMLPINCYFLFLLQLLLSLT